MDKRRLRAAEEQYAIRHFLRRAWPVHWSDGDGWAEDIHIGFGHGSVNDTTSRNAVSLPRPFFSLTRVVGHLRADTVDSDVVLRVLQGLSVQRPLQEAASGWRQRSYINRLRMNRQQWSPRPLAK